MFENNNYDHDEDYQRYLDWKSRQEEFAKELEGYDHELDLFRENEAAEHQAAEHERDTENDYLLGDYGMGPISKWKRTPCVAAEDYDYDYEDEVKQLTTGQRVVQEAQAVSREDGWGGEEDVRQLAQVTVNGVYRYELEWLPETDEVRVEVDQYRNGDPLYYWYPDRRGTMHVLSNLLSIPEDKIRITGLSFFPKDGVTALTAFNYETRQFVRSTWRDYAEDGMAMQFNVEIEEEDENTIELPPGKMCENKCYDGACDGTNCEFKPTQPQERPHGIDGTQCDCLECVPDEFPETQQLEEDEEETKDMRVGEVLEFVTKDEIGPLAKYMEDYMNEEDTDTDEAPDPSKPASLPEDTLNLLEMHAFALLAALALYLLWFAYELF